MNVSTGVRDEPPGRLHVFCNAAASSGWAFTDRSILKSLHVLKCPEALEVGEVSLSKLLAGKVYDYLGVSSAATGAPYRRQLSIRRVWRTSAGT